LGQAVLSRLAQADALKSLGRGRRHVLWETLAQEKKARPMPLFDNLAVEDEPPVNLPPMHLEQEVFADYQSTGLSLKKHPVAFYREQLDQLRITPAQRLPELRNNAPVRVAGLVLMRQRPSTAKGITFVTLEDETGVINLVVHRKTWERYYQVARGAAGMIAHGKLESKYSVIHVVVRQLEDLSDRLQQLNTKSRDFR
jgi:error-prone DNA polymerase